MLLDHADFAVSQDLSVSYDLVVTQDANDQPNPSIVDKRAQLKGSQGDDTYYVTTDAVPKTIIVFSAGEDEAGVTLLGISADGQGWDETYQALYPFNDNISDDERNDLSVQNLKKLGAMKSDVTHRSLSPPTASQLELYKYLSTEEGALRIWNAANFEDDDAPPAMRASVGDLVDTPIEPLSVRSRTYPA